MVAHANNAVLAIVISILYGLSVPFKNRCPEVRNTLLSVIRGVVLFLLRPSVETVLLWVSPGFVADLVGDVMRFAHAVYLTDDTAVSEPADHRFVSCPNTGMECLRLASVAFQERKFSAKHQS